MNPTAGKTYTSDDNPTHELGDVKAPTSEAESDRQAPTTNSGEPVPTTGTPAAPAPKGC
ncbi:hypothetical protein [Natronococcus wangiae]|uniref:hypothetical protein n=1 Tax=Natronococcus wangiae TaxID=3068275 RepID=UPI00273FB2F7|nr:hypothetical protein [Natronococcus sp. AD5]